MWTIIRRAVFISLMVLFVTVPSFVFAEVEIVDLPANDQFFRARVLQIQTSSPENPLTFYSAQILSGPKIGDIIDVYQENIKSVQVFRDISPNDTIIVRSSILSAYPYELYDVYRQDKLWLIFVVFSGIIIAVTGWKGGKSLLGLILTLGVIFLLIIPLLSYTSLPIILSILIGAILILIISLYLSHGWNKETHAACISSTISLLIAVLMGWGAITFMQLQGLGSGEAIFLQLGNLDTIDLSQLLLGAMILGTVGVLDDVTIVQTNAIKQLKQVNPNLSQYELYSRALRIGHEHIVSMVNTLFIAYLGAALPMLLLYTTQQHVALPLWVVLNSENVVEELLRSMVGSGALVLSVPISTALAAWWQTKHS